MPSHFILLYPLSPPRCPCPPRPAPHVCLTCFHHILLYNNPSLLLRDTPAKCKVRPRALCADRADYVQLVIRLRDLGMICFKDNVKVVNGVFAVEKDADWLRLIIDARPANCVFTEPDSVQLPGPDLLAQ